MFFGNPLALFAYGAQMGQDTVQQIVPGIQNLVGRIVKGEMADKEAIGDFMESLSGFVGLVVETLPEYLPFREQVMGIVGKLPLQFPIQLPQLPFQLPQLPFQLPFAAAKPAEASLERVTITVAPPKA